MIKNFLFFIFILFSSVVFSQNNTLIYGKVLDSETKEPIPFANIVFKNTTKGTISAVDGSFELQTIKNVHKVVVSYIGYKSKEIDILKGKKTKLRVLLKEDSELLGEIELVSKKRKKEKSDSPAMVIMKNVWANKKKNISKSIDILAYDEYEKAQIDINNFGDDFKNSAFFKKFQFIFEYADTSELNGKTTLPFILNESQYKVLKDKNTKESERIFLANKIAGFEDNKNVQSIIESVDMRFDIYKPTITVFQKSFLSPLSSFGSLNYFYYLKDSTVTNGNVEYHLQYIPRRSHELTFFGDIYVDKADWVVRKISLRVDKKANLNFISDLLFEQEYAYNDERKKWLLKKDKLTADFQLLKLKDQFGFYGHRTITYNNYKFNHFWTPTYVDSLKELGFRSKNEMELDIVKTRPQELEASESGIYTMVDSMKKTPQFKKIDKIIYIGSNAFYPINNYKYDVGPVWNIYTANKIEGNRFYLGGKTSVSYNKNWHSYHYIAYGTRDKKFKYYADFNYLLNAKKHHTIGIGFKKDYEVLTETNLVSLLNFGTIFSSDFTKQRRTNFMQVERFTIKSLKDLSRNFRIEGRFNHTNYKEVGELKFDFIEANKKKEFQTADAKFTLHYDLDPKYVSERSTQRTQLFIDNKLNAKLHATFGIDEIFGSDEAYQKFQLIINFRRNLNYFGKMYGTLDFGKLYGEVPYPLLFQSMGNQTKVYSRFKFSLANNFEYLSDQYAQIYLEQHFEGAFFNRIPLLRSLKLREIIGLKGVYGTLSGKNALQTIDGNTIIAPDDKGYWEASIGIANFLKVLRLDYVWRLSKLDDNYPNYGKKRGLRFRMEIRL